MKKIIHNTPVLLVIFILSASLAYNMGKSAYDVWQKRDIVTDREKELMRVQKENTELKRELERSNDPDYIEEEARNKLGLAKPGETVIFVAPPESNGAGDGNSIREKTFNKPYWKEWWKLFF